MGDLHKLLSEHPVITEDVMHLSKVKPAVLKVYLLGFFLSSGIREAYYAAMV